MYFADLSHYRYLLKTELPRVRNVGWLEAGHPLPAGRTSSQFLAKLEALMLLRDPVDVHVNRLRGCHPCALSACGPLVIGEGKARCHLGSSEIWIPGHDFAGYWAAPSMVLHYARDHGYLPPRDFVAAVERMDPAAPFSAQQVYLREVAGQL